MISKPSPGNKRSGFLPFKYPDFGKLLTGQLVSNIGSQFSYIAILFLVYDLTGDIYAMAFADIGQAFAIILIPLTSNFSNRVIGIIGIAFVMRFFLGFFTQREVPRFPH